MSEASHFFEEPDDDAPESIFHPVLLTVPADDDWEFTGIATIEFKKGQPVTNLPFRIIPSEGRFLMALIGRTRADFVMELKDYALWTENYAEFFDLDTAHPVLLLDAFEQ